MYTRHVNAQVLITLCFVIIICACSNTPLEKYVPKDREEARILALLIRYQDARKNFDLKRYLACLHENGFYNNASRVMVSKRELSEALPEFWTQLQEGKCSFFPMCRENLSGNYFVGFSYIKRSAILPSFIAAIQVQIRKI